MGDSFSISVGFGCPLDARPDLAEAQYREAIGIDPLFGTGYLNLTTSLWWMGRPVEALDALEQGLAAQPANTTLAASRAFNLVFADRVDEAEALLRAREGTPARVVDHATWAFIALRRKRFAEADDRLRQADEGGLFRSLAWTMITAFSQFQAGRQAEGGAYLARGVRMQSDCAEWATEVPAFAPYRDLPAFRRAIAASVQTPSTPAPTRSR